MTVPSRRPDERPVNPNAARDHLANERTLLAWLRSCIAIVGLGFVVARFGLVLDAVGSGSKPFHPNPLSTAIGILLVASGAALILLATRRYQQTTRQIDDNVYHASPALLVALSAGFVVVAILLALYLLVI